MAVFLDVEHPAVLLAHVGVVGAAKRVWMESLIGGNRSRAAGFGREAHKLRPIPIAGEVAVIHDDGRVVTDQMLSQADGMNRAQLVDGMPTTRPVGQ